jgi:hypothetical protein
MVYFERDQTAASNEPVKLCHNENSAPGRAAAGANRNRGLSPVISAVISDLKVR